MSKDKNKRDCTNCSFNYPSGKKKIPYCTLKRFPILNPDVGCSKHIKKAREIKEWFFGFENNNDEDKQTRFEI